MQPVNSTTLGMQLRTKALHMTSLPWRPFLLEAITRRPENSKFQVRRRLAEQGSKKGLLVLYCLPFQDHAVNKHTDPNSLAKFLLHDVQDSGVINRVAREHQLTLRKRHDTNDTIQGVGETFDLQDRLVNDGKGSRRLPHRSTLKHVNNGEGSRRLPHRSTLEHRGPTFGPAAGGGCRRAATEAAEALQATRHPGNSPVAQICKSRIQCTSQIHIAIIWKLRGLEPCNFSNVPVAGLPATKNFNKGPSGSDKGSLNPLTIKTNSNRPQLHGLLLLRTKIPAGNGDGLASPGHSGTIEFKRGPISKLHTDKADLNLALRSLLIQSHPVNGHRTGLLLAGRRPRRRRQCRRRAATRW